MQNQNPGSESHLSNGTKVTTTSAFAGPSLGPSLSGSLEAATKANPMDIPMASPSDGAQNQPQIQSQSQSHSPTSPLFRSLTPTQASTSAVATSGTPNSALATATVPSTAHQVPLSTMEAGTSLAQHVLNAAQRKQNIACKPSGLGCRWKISVWRTWADYALFLLDRSLFWLFVANDIISWCVRWTCAGCRTC